MKASIVILFMTLFVYMPVKAQESSARKQSIAELKKQVAEKKARNARLKANNTKEETEEEREAEIALIEADGALVEEAKERVKSKVEAIEKTTGGDYVHDYSRIWQEEIERLKSLNVDKAAIGHFTSWFNANYMPKQVNGKAIKQDNDILLGTDFDKAVQQKALQAQGAIIRDKKTKEASQAIKDIDEILDDRNFSNQLTDTERDTLEKGRDILRNQNLRRKRIQDLENQIEKQQTEKQQKQDSNISKELKDLTEQEEQEDNSDLYATLRKLQKRKAELLQQINQSHQH